MQDRYTFALAGSTEHTVKAVQGLLHRPDFSLTWVLTPTPRIIGRDKTPTPNPVHLFAQEQRADLFLISKSLTEVEEQLRQQTQPDFVIVVDFGYLLPQWSLDLAKIAPINVHPSALPRWRGSAPGQFVLLHGERNSAVTIMIPNLELDQGPIVTSLPLTVDPSWTYPDYYNHSFDLTSRSLPDVLVRLANRKISPQPQPAESPTPDARRLTRADGFVAWETIQQAMVGNNNPTPLNDLLSEARSAHPSLTHLLVSAQRGLTPWPGLWTEVPKGTGKQRMKILELGLVENAEKPQLQLIKVQLEGKTPSAWKEISAQIV